MQAYKPLWYTLKMLKQPYQITLLFRKCLIKNENNRFWVEIVRKPYTNASAVNARYGYPKYVAEPVTLPSQGFIKLQNCSVQAMDMLCPYGQLKK